MVNTNTFENITFDHTVNTIAKENFPKTFPLHWHKYVEIIGLPEESVSDTPALQIQNQTYSLSPGDLLIIWPGELHEITSNDKQQIIGIQFSLTLFHELPDFAPYLQYFRNYHHISIETMTELSQNMMSHMKQILSLQHGGEDFRNVESLICLYEFFLAFGKYLKKQLPDEIIPFSSPAALDKKINSICHYIAENCEKDLSLDRISDMAGFSPYYFSRKFKRLTNNTFIEYLAKQRIKKAQMLLSDFSLSMTDIAYQSGFKSISTFNRAFLKYKGCSPSEYRQYYHKEYEINQ